MNTRIIRYILGRILLIEGLLLLLPLLVSVYYREDSQHFLAFLVTMVAVVIIGGLLSYAKPDNMRITATEGLVIVGIGWLLLSAVGAVPFMLSGDIPRYVDAFFETASGFTTTGSSVVVDLTTLSQSGLFWRSFTHFIGGMGVLVFTLAILPKSESASVQLMRAEVPGPIFGKLVSRLSYTARILYGIYVVMTLVLIGILFLGGVPLFDATLLSFGTAGTGGFAISPYGFTQYVHPAFVEYVIAIGMLLFGVNFNLYYFMLIGHVRAVLKDEEVRYYIAIVSIAIVLIFTNLVSQYQNMEELFRHVLFTVSSVITTTGYATADFAMWPLFAQVILLLLMFIGGCAGSTAGGLKVSRIIMYIKMSFAELQRMGHPRRVVTPSFSGKELTRDVSASVSNYLFVYVLFYLGLLLSVSFEATDFFTAFSSVAATFNNIGPGMGAVGPTGSFAHYSDWNKWLLSVGMIAGRLELFPIVVLFAPTTLRRLFARQGARNKQTIV